MVEEAAVFSAEIFGREDVFNRQGWDYVAHELGGRIPVSWRRRIFARIGCRLCTGGAFQIRIRAVPEGSVVPVGNALFVVESTDERVPWAATYFEDLIVQVCQSLKGPLNTTGVGLGCTSKCKKRRIFSRVNHHQEYYYYCTSI